MERLELLILCCLPLLVAPYYVKVGILSDDPDTSTTAKVWSLAQNYSTMMSLEPVVKVTQWWAAMDAPAIARSVCSLSDKGVDALVYLGPPRWNYLVSSYSDHLGLPFIAAVDSGGKAGRYQVNVMPSTTRAAADFIKYFEWTKFAFIYETNYGPDQLQEVMQLLLKEGFAAEVEAFWRAASADAAFQYVMQLLQPDARRRIVLATSERFADELAARLASRRNYNLLLLTAVGTVQRTPTAGFYKLTKLSVVEAEDSLLKTLENRLRTLPSHAALGRMKKDIPDSTVLHYESSSILNTMFNQIAREKPEALRPRQNLDCLKDAPSPSEAVHYLKRVVVERGVTGKIVFDETGSRKDYKMNVVQVTPFDVQKVGTWSDADGLQASREFSKESLPRKEAYKSDPPLRVSSSLVPPFLYLKDGKYEGFVKDFLDALTDKIKRDYQLNLVKDGFYGTKIGGRWTGFVGELVRGEVDLVVADLTKTREREEVIDFSKNFMSFGLNIAMKRSQAEAVPAFGPFSFLSVWSPAAWLVILAAVLVFSGTGYGIGRFVGAPDRVRALETKGTDKLSPCGSLWLTVGSLLCRNTGIYPRNLTHRLWALLWWVFCISVSLLYVSMLTVELIHSRSASTTTHSRKTSQELLKESLDTGYPDIGALSSGSTVNFFLKSDSGIYQQFGHYLMENPHVMTRTIWEGLERVRNSNGSYAFITESTATQLIANRKPCDIVVTSGFLDTKTYAVGLQKNSSIKELIDHGVLSLLETGTLRELYEKWWHNYTTECEDPSLDLLPKIYSSSMSLYEVSGLFYLLIALTILTLAAAVVEYHMKTKHVIME